MIRWKRREVTLKKAMGGDAKNVVELDTVRALATPYLAVHKNPFRKKGDYDWFSVTHTQTGFRVCGFPKQRQAKRFVELVAHLPWDFTKPNGNHVKALWGPVQAAIVQVQEEAKHG